MSKELEKVLSRLSQKSKEKEKAEAEEVEELEEEDAPLEDPKPEVKVTPELKPTTNKIEEELNQQVMRLRDDGLYRVELLYQYQLINENLKAIKGYLKKLFGDGEGNTE